MNNLEVTNIDLVEGGNVFKQGHHLTLGYIPHDEKGGVVDLSNKILSVSIWGRIGVVFEGSATFSAETIRFTLKELIPAGEYQVEFTATSSTDADYRKKFPTNSVSGRITVKKSSDDLEATGVSVITVTQFRKEFDAAVAAVTEDAEVILARDGETLLGNRLDKDKQELTRKLGEKLSKGTVTVSDIDKNKGKLDQTYMSPEFLQQIAGNTPVNAVPADDSLRLKQLTFYKESTNIYNEGTVKLGKYLNQTTGAEVTEPQFVASDFIKVKGLTEVFIKKARHVVFYNENQTFKSGVADTVYKSNYVAQVNGAAWLRVSWAVTDTPLELQQVNAGGVELPYEKHYILIDKEVVEKHDITVADIPPIPAEKLDFLQKSTNLFDKTKLLYDRYISGATGGLTAGAGFVATEYIPVEELTPYIIQYIRHYAYYDSGKVKIESNTLSPIGEYKAKSPAGARFIRFSWYPPNDNLVMPMSAQQMNKGDKLLTFEEYGNKIPTSMMPLGGATGKVPSGTLAPKIFGVVGEELNIYFDNFLDVPADSVQIDVTCSIGRHLEGRWSVIPEASGTYDLKIKLHKDYVLVNELSTTIIIKAASVGTGVTKTALTLGDSTINQDWLLMQTMLKLSTDPLNITLLGTRGTNGVKHEGRGGWSAAQYRTNSVYLGEINPFYDETTKDFSLPAYMQKYNLTRLDYFPICLGINDVFAYSDDTSLKAAITKILSDLDFIITNVHSYDPTVKVGVFVTIPPTADADSFGEAYKTGQTLWRYKRNNEIWIESLVNHYKNREAENIHLIPDNTNINRKTGFRDGVHPNEEIGDKQRGDTLYYWFKSFEM